MGSTQDEKLSQCFGPSERKAVAILRSNVNTGFFILYTYQAEKEQPNTEKSGGIVKEY